MSYEELELKVNHYETQIKGIKTFIKNAIIINENKRKRTEYTYSKDKYVTAMNELEKLMNHIEKEELCE